MTFKYILFFFFSLYENKIQKMQQDLIHASFIPLQPLCCILATGHKLQSIVINLYNNLRLTVHLRPLNLEKLDLC